MDANDTDALARGFIATAILWGIAGLVLGLWMAIGQDHGQRPTHAHIQVIGWLSFAVFAVCYKLFGIGMSKLLARVHFWLAQASMLGIGIGLLLFYGGHREYEPIAAVSSVAYAISFLVFAVPMLRRCLTAR